MKADQLGNLCERARWAMGWTDPLDVPLGQQERCQRCRHCRELRPGVPYCSNGRFITRPRAWCREYEE